MAQRTYCEVQTAFWTSPDTRALSHDARHLLIYLLTSPLSNMIGCYRAPHGYIAADLQWSDTPDRVSDRVSDALEELAQKGIVFYCPTTQFVLLSNYLKFNSVKGPKQAAGAYKCFHAVPDQCSIKPCLARILTALAPAMTYPLLAAWSGIGALETGASADTLSDTLSGRVPIAGIQEKQSQPQSQNQSQNQSQTQSQRHR